MSFWDVIWAIIVAFAFIAYVLILFRIVEDVFRDDRGSSGWTIALWIVGLVIFPVLAAVVYLIVHGPGLVARHAEEVRAGHHHGSQPPPVGVAPRKSAAEEIELASRLLATGSINQAEFEQLKTQSLA